MAIEIFQGKYISADDATKTIDMPTIDEGCKMLKTAAEQLEQLTKKIDLLRETYNREAISVAEANMEEIVEAYEKQTNDFSLYINDLAEMLETTTKRVVNKKQLLLNEEAKRLDEKEALLHNDISLSTDTITVQEDDSTSPINDSSLQTTNINNDETKQ